MAENKNLTLGSLFDGSGGFPLGGMLAGITPVWASEIEPFAIRVTSKRMPFMKHYGDISQMDGSKIEPVDIITFGSPCQDMSVAGKRNGLDGTRSSLFYEAVRIIKEMRSATNGKYPRFIVWENVPGAFSSNGGEDFKAVLEAVIGIVEETASVPAPPKNEWAYADCILGDGWSIAYRVLDAQYWGVPQRRKRIFLVADFAGGSAADVLFKSEGLSRYSAEGFRAWQRAARSAEGCIGTPGFGDAGCGGIEEQAASPGVVLNDQGGSRMEITEDIAATLRAEAHHPPCVCERGKSCPEGCEDDVEVYENHSQDTRYTGPLAVAPTISSKYGTGGNNQPFVVGTPKTLKIRCGKEGGGKGALIQDDKSATLATNNDQTVFVPQPQSWDGRQISPTLTKENAGGNQRMPDKGNFTCVLEPFGISAKDSNAMKSPNPHSGIYRAKTARTVDCNGGNPACNQGGIAVVCVEPAICIQGSMIGRQDQNGPVGSGLNEEKSFTLNTKDRHAVAFGIGRDAFNQGRNAKYKPAIEEELQPTIIAKGPGAVAVSKANYTIRRLTPTECARLQGFPDWWCRGLGTEKPTSEEVYSWYKVFETYRKIAGTGKPKTEKQIRTWLQNPHSDSAEYRLWGNGVALPCVFFVLAGIAWAAENDTNF